METQEIKKTCPETITIRANVELLETFKKIVKEKDQTPSQVIRWFIRDYIKASTRQQKRVG